jgi:hypothetical protein
MAILLHFDLPSSSDWLPVSRETNRPGGANGRDCKACARSVCQEPSEVNTSRELGIADVSVKCLARSAERLCVKVYRLQLLQVLNPQDHNLRLHFCMFAITARRRRVC